MSDSKSKFSDWLPRLSGFLALVGIVVGTYTMSGIVDLDFKEMNSAEMEVFKVDRNIIYAKRLEEVKLVSNLSDRFEGMELKLASISKMASAKTLSNYEKAFEKIPSVENEINNLRNELKNLKNIMSGDPDAVLTLGSIKKDIEMLKKSDERMYQDIGNYATLAMWIIGVLITLSLALFGFSISAHLRR